MEKAPNERGFLTGLNCHRRRVTPVDVSPGAPLVQREASGPGGAPDRLHLLQYPAGIPGFEVWSEEGHKNKAVYFLKQQQRQTALLLFYLGVPARISLLTGAVSVLGYFLFYKLQNISSRLRFHARTPLH
jgi:hypothetical protein